MPCMYPNKMQTFAFFLGFSCYLSLDTETHNSGWPVELLTTIN